MQAQDWLEQNYPDKERTHIIYLNQQLEGILDCGDYKNLGRIYISTQVEWNTQTFDKSELDGSKIEIIKGSYKDNDKIKETKIIPCILAQDWLNQNYPQDGTCIRENKKYGDKSFGKKREQITELYIGRKGLEGNLDLSDFTNLEELNCWNNCLTNLNLSNCGKLKRLHCSNNHLTQIVYPPNLEKITYLNIRNNNISPTNLTIFSPMRNLESLDIGNDDKNKISQGIYNKIEGSWETLKDLNKLEILNISNTDINSGWEYLPNSLERLYYDTKLRPDCKLAQVAEQWNQGLWKDIHQDFAPKYKKEWLDQGFSKEQTKEWIDVGAKPKSAKFLNWFLNFKKLDLDWALKNEEEFKGWKDGYENFGTCKECQQPNTSFHWCHSCNAKHFLEDFCDFKWNSGNITIDSFILKCQLGATSKWNVLEWIPYKKFGNIQHIADGGFGKVYKAGWMGSILGWNNEKREWRRIYKAVALKTLTNSQNLKEDFLQELTLYKMFKSEVSNMVPCYGISKDTEGNYILVMEYMKEGNLRGYLKKNKELKFYDEEEPRNNSKLKFLQEIIQGLKDIHRKQLVHQDFHSGNIIVGGSCCITDLGLSKPANETEQEGKIYGVMPYVAPEVLLGKPYTPASDIYSLGMIMYEVLTCLPPFAGEKHEINLSLQICQGIRPQFPKQVKYPQILVDLIEKCWEQEPNNRPTAKEISGIVGEWFYEDGLFEGNLKSNTELYQQLEEAEEHNQTLPDEIKYPTYQSSEVWNSKPINTQQITELYQASKDLELDLDNFNLDELTIREDPQEQSSHQAQVEVPPK